MREGPTIPAGGQRAERLSLEASRQLAQLIAIWMDKAGLRSVYELYLLVDVPRATLHRWLKGQVRVPEGRGREILGALASCVGSSEPLKAFDRFLVSERDSTSWNQRLREELRARRVPIKRALDALSAARALPETGDN